MSQQIHTPHPEDPMVFTQHLDQARTLLANVPYDGRVDEATAHALVAVACGLKAVERQVHELTVQVWSLTGDQRRGA